MIWFILFKFFIHLTLVISSLAQIKKSFSGIDYKKCGTTNKDFCFGATKNNLILEQNTCISEQNCDFFFKFSYFPYLGTKFYIINWILVIKQKNNSDKIYEVKVTIGDQTFIQDKDNVFEMKTNGNNTKCRFGYWKLNSNELEVIYPKPSEVSKYHRIYLPNEEKEFTYKNDVYTVCLFTAVQDDEFLISKLNRKFRLVYREIDRESEKMMLETTFRFMDIYPREQIKPSTLFRITAFPFTHQQNYSITNLLNKITLLFQLFLSIIFNVID